MIRKKADSEAEQRNRRMQWRRAELAERIAGAMPHDGTRDVQTGLRLSRVAQPTELHHGFYEPCFCVVAQGAKTLTLGEDVFRYDPAHYLIATVGVPMTAQVVEASPKQPYLGLRLELDPGLVASVIMESGLVESRGSGAVKAVNVSELDADLLDATVRLMRLIDQPTEYRAIAPLVIREIVYRLLTGAQSERMRHLAAFGGQAQRVVQAVAKLRESFDKPLRIKSMARELGMSLSGFHAHFKAVTAMSPLQFQKQLRLQEARRLMLSENLDAAEAGYRVGYDDPSQFSREYKRRFGAPPMRDVERLRGRATA